MLRPDKHTEIKYSIVFLSALMLKEIQKSGIVKYDELRSGLMDKIGRGVADNFELTLSFLFLLGKIEYVKNLDSFKSAKQ